MQSPKRFGLMQATLLLMLLIGHLGAARASALDEPLQPLPPPLQLDQRKVALGQALFQDTRLSYNNSTACSSCHRLEQGGADGRAYSTQANGQATSVNTPTVFNAAFNFTLLWDGSFNTLEAQVDEALTRNGNTRWSEVIPKLQRDRHYQKTFADIYPNGIQADNIKDAIATYERSLTTPNARFDRFLRGDPQAINAEEKAGYQRFKSYGCASCHQGKNIGGNMLQRFGVMGNYFADRGHITRADLGRFNVTGVQQDRHVFRVPSLRNVALTAPYLHDANAKDLKTAITIMAKYQLGRPIPDSDIEKIIAFLHTLTGEYQGKPLSARNYAP